jgi:hypothetical protein
MTDISWQKFSFFKQNHLALPFYNIEKISIALKIPVDKILRAEIESLLTPQIIQYELMNRLPEKYHLGRGSKSFTLRHLIKLADKKGIKNLILKEFNISEHLISAKIDFEIPVQLVADIMDSMARKVSLYDEDFSYLADLNAFYFKDSGFGKMLRAATSPNELYENLIFVTKYLEDNWSYEISSIKNDTVLLTSHPTESLCDIYQRKDYSTLNFTRFRIAVAANLLKYIGINSVEASISRSIHLNDNCDQFSIDLSTIRQQPSHHQSLQLQ